LPRCDFDGRTNVVACASDTHLHVLGNSDREISFRVFWLGFSSIQLLKSLDESLNAGCLFLHFISWINDTSGGPICSPWLSRLSEVPLGSTLASSLPQFLPARSLSLHPLQFSVALQQRIELFKPQNKTLAGMHASTAFANVSASYPHARLFSLEAV
jgi:hypothetical protein